MYDRKKALAQDNLALTHFCSIHRRLDIVKQLLEDGGVTTQDIDRNAEAVLNLLTKIAPLGFSASPEKEHEKSVDDAEINRSIRQIAAEGAVLVKNEGSLLPLDLAKVKKIALIGKPWTDAIQSGGGSANLTPQKVSPLLSFHVWQVKVFHAREESSIDRKIVVLILFSDRTTTSVPA